MHCVRHTLVHVPIRRKSSDGILLEGRIGWCTVYIVQCISYSVQCKVYSVQCTMYIVQCTVYSEKYTAYSVQCTVYSRIGRPAREGLGGRHKFLRKQAAPRSQIEHCNNCSNCYISQISPGIEIYLG